MIFNQVPVGIHDAEGHILDVDETVLGDLDYTREEFSMKVLDIEDVRQRAHEERPRREPDEVDVDGDPRPHRNETREVGRRHLSHELERTQTA